MHLIYLIKDIPCSKQSEKYTMHLNQQILAKRNNTYLALTSFGLILLVIALKILPTVSLAIIPS